jgi:DNA transformation protein
VANSPDFVTHALELLSGAGDVEARSMFGGHGVYARGVMFALLDDDELFLKTDEVSRPRFAEAGCRSWVYVGRNGRIENTSYFRPPDGAHEDPEAMAAWAALGLEAALRLREAKARGGAGGRKRAAKRGARTANGRPSPRSGKRAGSRTRSHAARPRGRARPR